MLEAYLDIETTGLSPTYDAITVIGIYLTDGSSHRIVQLVGEEVTRANLLEALQGVGVIYTYNGSGFDLPFIRTLLGVDLTEDFKHHDLMLDCWKNNLYGGFKAVEVQLGIGREMKGVNGREAVKLWWRYRIDNDQDALAMLLKYNEEDVMNLDTLRERLSIGRNDLTYTEYTNMERRETEMAVLGNRRGGNPIVLNLDDSIANPRRVPFTEKMFEEGWLQDLIEDHPELLPIAEIEPAFAPVVSVGREVATASGYIDNLLLSPQGYLTIVETKLWRNPEARREVVGQIIDYAKDVSRWTFVELESKLQGYNIQRCQSNLGILDSLRQIEDIDESEEQIIIDTISRNLHTGRFLLLVVGEGIRESVEEMADFLQQTPQLHFTLALVELQIYELGAKGNKPLLVIPQIVARTREITRAVVRVEGKAIESVKVEVDTEITTAEKPAKRFTLSEEDFFNTLRQRVDAEDVEFAHQIIEDVQGLGCKIDWQQASFAVKLRDPAGSGQNLSLLVVKKDGLTYLRAELPEQLRSMGLPEQIASDYFRESSQLFVGNGRMLSESASKAVSLKELRQQYKEFVFVLQKTINRIREASKR